MTEVNRFEVIDYREGRDVDGDRRAFVGEGVSVELAYQDDGRTLKVFVTDGDPVVREPGWLQSGWPHGLHDPTSWEY